VVTSPALASIFMAVAAQAAAFRPPIWMLRTSSFTDALYDESLDTSTSMDSIHCNILILLARQVGRRRFLYTSDGRRGGLRSPGALKGG